MVPPPLESPNRLALAGVSGHIAYLDALWWHSLGLSSTVATSVSRATIMLLTAHAVVSVVCSILAITLVLDERHRQEASRALGVAFAAWSYLMAYSGVTMLFRPIAPGLAREVFEAHFLAIEVLGLVALVRFTSIFPRPLLDEELQPTESLPAVLLPFHQIAVFMRHRTAAIATAVAVLSFLWLTTLATGGALSDAGLSPAMDVIRFLAAGLVVMNLRRAWGVSTEGDRDSLTWLLASLSFLLGSLALLIGGNVLVAVTGFPEPNVAWRPILFNLGMIGFLTGIAMSVLQRGRIDPAHLTRRIATVAALITGGLFLAAGLEALFSGGVDASLSVRKGVGTAIAFAITLSTHKSLERFIERLLPS
jgi:hypothetical protein